MDVVGILVLVVGCIVFYEGVRRLDLLAKAGKQTDGITDKSETGNPENCISYRIFLNPMDEAKWKPGIGAAIDRRPFLLFLTIILVLTILFSTYALVSSYSSMSIVLLVLAFAFAFHSAPDNITVKERYLEIMISQDQSKLNGHDWRTLSNALKEYKSWPKAQIVFGLLFATLGFWPEWVLFYVVLLILLGGFIFLGSKYSITKGIYGSAE